MRQDASKKLARNFILECLNHNSKSTNARVFVYIRLCVWTCADSTPGAAHVPPSHLSCWVLHVIYYIMDYYVWALRIRNPAFKAFFFHSWLLPKIRFSLETLELIPKPRSYLVLSIYQNSNILRDNKQYSHHSHVFIIG